MICRLNSNGLHASRERWGSATDHTLGERAWSFGSRPVRGSQQESGTSSQMSAGPLDNDHRSLAQDGVPIYSSQSATSPQNGMDGNAHIPTQPGPIPVMQSASIMQSGFNPLLSAELRSQNSEPHPVNRLGTQPGNRQPPEGRDSLPRHELAIEAPENAISHPNRHARRQQKQTKAAIKIASINMRGYGHQNVLHRQNKWNHNNQVIREKRIAVLLVQEAHMDDERKNQVENIS